MTKTACVQTPKGSFTGIVTGETETFVRVKVPGIGSTGKGVELVNTGSAGEWFPRRTRNGGFVIVAGN
jgi:hypothetical protein